MTKKLKVFDGADYEGFHRIRESSLSLHYIGIPVLFLTASYSGGISR
jgi:hypothetical protein